jgi:hypothetical protein
MSRGVQSLARRIALLAGLVLASCGYSTGLRVAERHQTIGVEFFGNRTYERDLERPFYDELSRVLRDTSDAALVDPGRAQVVVRGTIRSFHRRSGVRSTDNERLETGIYFEVEAVLVDRARDVPIRGPVRHGAWVGYTLVPPENERDARERAMRNVAQELVLDLFAPVN